MHTRLYIEHPGKVVEDARFSHMMALTLDPSSHNTKGVIRCITSREGDLEIKGYTDRSELFAVSGDSLEKFAVEERLEIKNEKEIIDQLGGSDWDCIGLEDPDIWIDPATNLTHLYFTMPFIHRSRKDVGAAINLGHAVGSDLNSLIMTEPVLLSQHMGGLGEGAKEVSIAPINKHGVRLNLIESSDGRGTGHKYSTVRVAVAQDMSKPWEYGDTVFHPADADIPWIGGHASPGPLFSKNFIDVGAGKALGIMNGREADTPLSDKIKYGIFSVGLMIYDYEDGKIDWVSPGPLIRDSAAKTITFASQFVETKNGEGILYAHVDDSFVRAYTLTAESLKKIIG